MRGYFPKRRSKYGSIGIRTANNGNYFHSKLESAVYDLLKLEQSAGLIRDIKIQQHIYLTKAKIHYIADFSIFDLESNDTIYVEAKGYETPEWRIKLRLYRHYGPKILRIYKGTHRSPQLFEVVIPIKSDENN